MSEIRLTNGRKSARVINTFCRSARKGQRVRTVATLERVLSVKLGTLGFCYLNKGKMQKSFHRERDTGKINFLE